MAGSPRHVFEQAPEWAAGSRSHSPKLIPKTSKPSLRWWYSMTAANISAPNPLKAVSSLGVARCSTARREWLRIRSRRSQTGATAEVITQTPWGFDIGKRSSTGPVTPSCGRVRTQRFGGSGNLPAVNLGRPSSAKKVWGRDAPQSRAAGQFRRMERTSLRASPANPSMSRRKREGSFGGRRG